jgi:hypothetical protein
MVVPPGARSGRGAILFVGSGLIVVVAPPHSGLGWMIGTLDALIGLSAATAAVIAVSVGLVLGAIRAAGQLRPSDRWAIRAGFVVGIVGYLLISLQPLDPAVAWRDAGSYWSGAGDPYAASYYDGGTGYPPPFFQLLAPLRALGWPAFLAIWSAVELLALLAITGSLAPVVLLVPFVALEVWEANVNLVIAAALTLLARWPQVFAVIAFTKVTPGIVLVSFAARRQVGRFALALAASALVVAVSFLLGPTLWAGWIAWLRTSGAPEATPLDLGPPVLRFVGAAGLVLVGYLRRWPWVLPLAAVLALPVIWPGGLSILVALIPLARGPGGGGPHRRAVDYAGGD